MDYLGEKGDITPTRHSDNGSEDKPEPLFHLVDAMEKNHSAHTAAERGNLATDK